MKKLLLIAAAAVAATVACTKVNPTGDAQREINFEVANSLTKATGSVYSNGAFGTYAWFNNTDDFMVNEKVDKVGSVWKTVDHTFYWPKTGSISFISYSPFEGTSDTAGTVPAITKNSITYTGITAGSTDLMYADRATCSSNVNEVTDSDTADSGFSGVPTVFRHALAKLSFKIKANFITYTDPTTNTTTSWEVKVTSAKIGGFKTTGDCALALNSDGKSWDKPETQVANPAYDGSDPSIPQYLTYNVWKNLSGTTSEQELIDATTYPSGVILTTTAQDLAAASGYVMPQILEAGAQQIKLTVHIKTTLSNGKEINEDFTPTIDIKDISSLKAWQMNENIVYTINIKPVAYVSDYDTPNDVIITFDPAVADWIPVDANATIQL
ncbi:MAG: fimbrillin family protein [Bacteroidales bacterium]|nr:fimbrillin family protein [Bacteroidales bacterium]